MKNKYIIFSSLTACFILFMIEQGIQVDYFVKTASKLILFIFIPFVSIYYINHKTLKEALNLKKLRIKDLTLGIIIGISSFLVVLLGYFLFKNVIDFSNIKNELEKSNITPHNFIFIGLYIMFINSLLEEFFFRGFIFLNLYQKGNKKFAYLFSSSLFALYHISIFNTWFNPYLMGLALVGLFIIGLIFDYLDTYSKNFLNSWIVHILADAGVITIGLMLFHIF